MFNIPQDTADNKTNLPFRAQRCHAQQFYKSPPYSRVYWDAGQDKGRGRDRQMAKEKAQQLERKGNVDHWKLPWVHNGKFLCTI